MQFIVVALALCATGAWSQDFENPFDSINADFAKGFPAKVATVPKKVVAAIDVSQALKEARQDLKMAAKKSSMASDQYAIAGQDFKGGKTPVAQRHEQEAVELKKEATDSYKKGAELLATATSLQTRKVKVTIDDHQLERDANSSLELLKDQQEDEKEAAHEAGQSFLQVVKPLPSKGAQVQNQDLFVNPFDAINADFSNNDDAASADLKDARTDLALAVKNSALAKDQLAIASQEFRGSKTALAQQHEDQAAELKEVAATSLAKGTELLAKAKELNLRKVTLDDEQLARDATNGLQAVNDQEAMEQESARETTKETSVSSTHAALVNMKAAAPRDEDQSALEHFLR